MITNFDCVAPITTMMMDYTNSGKLKHIYFANDLEDSAQQQQQQDSQ